MDCIWHGRRMALRDGWIEDIPADTRAVLENGSGREYIQTLAKLALSPNWTLRIAANFEPLLIEFCNRWMLNEDETGEVDFRAFSVICRLLSTHSNLAIYASELSIRRRRGIFQHLGLGKPAEYLTTLPGSISGPLLLSLYRCLRHDRNTFSLLFHGPQIQALFQHATPYIRYLAIKVFAVYLGAADAAVHRMLKKHHADGAVNGPWDDRTIDYRYLELWEKRLLSLYEEQRVDPVPQTEPQTARALDETSFSKTTIVIGGSLQPTVSANSVAESHLVLTDATNLNLQSLGASLTRRKPILLTGLPGSGKSALIRDVSRIYGKDTSMLTLHLNEQTDAKLLVGMYTSSASPGSFKWQPGVLTTAVREGRWALIEDLDRAPAEVMSTLLPLMERRQLYVPNLGGMITAHSEFRLFATIRSSATSRGQKDAASNVNFLGARHWDVIMVQAMSPADLRTVITEQFPLLNVWSQRVLEIYETLLANPKPANGVEKQTSVHRSLSPRDLFQCCRRVNQLLIDSGAKTGSEPVIATLSNNVFLEIVDCFVGFAHSSALREHVTNIAAQILQLSPQARDHCLRLRKPAKEETEQHIQLGRVSLQRRKQQKSGRIDAHEERPFAYTNDVLRKMETIAAAVRSREPCLLVGETGTGKTTAVQQLAKITGHKLTVVNLSQQSEAGDLLGGYKPLNLRSFTMPLKDDFEDLFAETVPVSENEKFIREVNRAFAKSQYDRLLKLWRSAVQLVKSKLPPPKTDTDEKPAKRRKLEKPRKGLLRAKWDDFAQRLNVFEMHVKSGGKGFAFHFVEGNIVKAVRNGDWVLLDEINLASPDTLESLADLLTNDSTESPSIILTETGDVERIRAHPDFRIFAAMNPATDVGKRDLPLSLRSRFTELYMTSPDRDPNSLLQIVEECLGSHTHSDKRAARNITDLYLEIIKLEEENKLVDGANQRPHYSLRTLTRTLAYVIEISPLYQLRRSLFEGFSMSFLTLLDKSSAALVSGLIDKHILGKDSRERKQIMNRNPKPPSDNKQYVKFEHYWLSKGPLEVGSNPRYIITKFIRANLLNLVRAASTRKFPVLLQGPTSSGKTSMVEHLAKISGNSFVRINNHEHTDLQEYLGTYITDNEGNLRFQEGLLVQALRQGHWIVLDELNLAPTDILEALNRLLDDNRELFIPETQEVVRPHENFMLFATQNPAGLYGGRKALSRAFRNRFLELHFDDIPENELQEILQQRTQIAESHAGIIIKIYRKLAELRQSSRLFEQKGSFATLRDLFRWALRDITSKEELALHGFMLLAERVRNEEEREAVRKTISDITKVKINPADLYSSLSARVGSEGGQAQQIVWTPSMRRIYVLVTEALKRNEPVLLVGGTGCGKTSVCQVIAELAGTQLHIVNAHQNTETGDLIGAQRPIRNRSTIESETRALLLDLLRQIGQDVAEDETATNLVSRFQALDVQALQSVSADRLKAVQESIVKHKALFEWSDGSLVHAMKEGTHFLLDEISLAEDSVLERLNSVLESGRTILLAEKGPQDSLITANPGFQFLATMNPGGDFGKRELSPALRNRFTEIWLPPMSSGDEIVQIAQAKLNDNSKALAGPMVAFSSWFAKRFNPNGPTLSIRDILAWVEFVNTCSWLNLHETMVEGAAMVHIDTLGANPAASLSLAPSAVRGAKLEALQHLGSLLEVDVSSLYFAIRQIRLDDQVLNVDKFSLKRTEHARPDATFSLRAPTTAVNMARVVRALQLKKPILLEGSPGVGKTTLVSALANAIGVPLTRINLSEQTDLMDLFGSDVPVEGGEAGQFAWRDAPFLQAMKRGEWVLLDEMNLASQSVLEGLNACLDHRGEVFIPELDQTFTRHPDFTIFAAQNPHSQGGGRKGLPASFVNRFTVVYADAFTPEDLRAICSERFAQVPDEVVQQVIEYVVNLCDLAQASAVVSASGGPWEFNLRDILRWLELISASGQPTSFANPFYFQHLLFLQRFRSTDAVSVVRSKLAPGIDQQRAERSIYRNASPVTYQAGLALLPRNQQITYATTTNQPRNTQVLESVMTGVGQQWPVLLVGPSGSGKTSILRHLAGMVGQELLELPLSADMDTMDIVGGYEQADPHRLVGSLMVALQEMVRAALIRGELADAADRWDILAVESPEQLDLPKVHAFLEAMASDSDSQLWQDLLDQCTKVESRLSEDLRARFEWADGLLVQALERGKWLILDNANLCSSSVLDRLNSLLEPNGFLAINEHKRPDGSARVIKPHPNFRLFLTMDPRHGELSRAMRNRCLELFMPDERAGRSYDDPLEITDSSLFRFQPLVGTSWSILDADLLEHLVSVSFDHFAFTDKHILDTLPEQISEELLPAAQAFPAFSPSAIRSFISSVQNATAFGESTREMYQGSLSLLSMADAEVLANYESVHPMNNSMLLSVISRSNPATSPQVIAALFSGLANVRCLLQRREARRVALSDGASKATTRLDRSFLADRVLAFSKDDTAPLARVLYESFHSMGKWLTAQSGKDLDQEAIVVVKQVIAFLADLLDVSMTSNFDDATFQAFLAIGNRIVSAQVNSGLVQQCLTTFAGQLGHFRTKWQLQTGHGMKNLWNVLRPPTAQNDSQRQTLRKLEGSMSTLSQLLVGTTMPYSVLAQMQQRILDVYNRIFTRDIDEASVEQVLTSIEEFIRGITLKDEQLAPHFQGSFQGLAQLIRLSGNECNVSETLELATCRPIRPSSHIQTQSTFSKALLDMQQATGLLLDESPLHAVRQTVMPTLMGELETMDKVSIGALERLENELGELPKAVVETCKSSGADPMTILNAELVRLHEECSQALNIFLSSTFAAQHEGKILQLMQEFGISSLHVGANTAGLREQVSAPIEQIFETHLSASLASIVSQPANLAGTAKAWLSFFVGCLLLYVPDKPFDPALESKILVASHRKRKQELETSLKALVMYEEMSGLAQKTPRIQMVEEELADLGDEPPSSGAFRPEQSRLNQLSGDFNNIRNSIISRCQDINLQDASVLPEISIIIRNVEQAISRLHTNYRDYDDIIQPANQLLIGLRLGLELAVVAGSQRSIELSNAMLYCTPMLDMSRKGLLSLRMKDFKKTGKSKSRLLFLHAAATDTKIEGNMDAHYLMVAQQIFDDLYSSWSRELAKEQRDHATNSSLYRYRGVEEDHEDVEQVKKEMQQLFPVFDDSRDNGKDETSEQVQDQSWLAKQLADAHAALFNNGNSSQESFNKLVSLSLDKLTKFFGLKNLSGSCSVSAQQLLPSVLLMLSNKTQAISPAPSDARQDFYRDANLKEVKKMLDLAKRVRSRFQTIHEAWPEQASPIDVLKVIEELLALAHTDPIAKILTKAEQLHLFVNQWEQVTSREFSASSLYNEVTDLLISWRRLELSSWATVLDVEDKNCEQDAKSWWFIAYETIIAASLSAVHNEQDFCRHVEALIDTLAQFMKTTCIGQFRQRLLMLQNFQLHVKALSKQQPGLSRLDMALVNFMAYYTRFQSSVDGRLKSGRQDLEKKMKEVILLSSWKDTNIEALKASSKASHTRLFKIIRKYRSLLAEPVETILGQDAPFNPPSQDTIASIAVVDTVDVDPKRLAVLQQSFASKSLPPRFQNVKSTLSIMRRHFEIPDGSVNVASYLSAWVEELVEESNKLQKATPTKLTEENKAEIQHLKVQKRRLFAGILKDLRVMGLKTNIDTQTLDAQASTAKMLATTLVVEHSDGKHAKDHEFFRVIDNLDKIRALSRDHADDLASNEVARSLVYLQGLVDLIIKQRVELSKKTRGLQRLTSVGQTLQELSASHFEGSLQVNPQASQNSAASEVSPNWLPIIIRFCARLLKVHDGMGGETTADIQSTLDGFAKDIELVAHDLNACATSLPAPLTDAKHVSALHRLSDLVDKLRTSLSSWDAEQHRSKFATSLIRKWLPDASNGRSLRNGVSAPNFEAFQDQATKMLDRLLKSLENTSKAVSRYPNSEEENGWLVKSSESLSAALNALNMDDNFSTIDKHLQQLGQFAHSKELQNATAVCAFMQPFFGAYHAACTAIFERAFSTYEATTKTTRVLSDSFRGLLNHGFCGPKEEQKGNASGQDKLEEGTGLGEGEGAEDISKDIQDDEDLSELAQSKQQEGENEEVEGEDNAVDMADQDLEGTMDEQGQEQDDEVEKDEEGEEDTGPEEELGDVGNDDPEAVDEKLWDGDDKQEESEEQNKGEKKSGKKEDQMAAQGEDDGQQDEGEDELSSAEDDADHGEDINDANMPAVDPHLQEEEKLDLPEDMDMDADQKSLGEESDLDDMQDIDDGKEEDQPIGEQGVDDAVKDEENTADIEDPDEMHDGKDADINIDSQAEDDTERDEENADQSDPLRDQNDTAMDAGEQDHGETEGVGGATEKEQQMEQDQPAETGGTEGQTGAKGESQGVEETEESEQQAGSGAAGENISAEDSLQDSAEAQAFKKLGDALEKFQRSSRDIRQAQNPEEKEQPPNDGNQDAAEFEHLPNDDAQTDTQALGNADEDQAKGLDEGAMDIDQPNAEAIQTDQVLLNGEEESSEQDETARDDPDAMDTDVPHTTSIGQRQAAGKTRTESADVDLIEQSSEEDIQELDDGLSEVHLQSPEADPSIERSAEDALQLWQQCELRTNDLAMSLTEQLRLILAPTLATKMRGDFRTGKRLNIKRIIPYIASQYKRDKIWMRRSIPSKRNYQIMLAVDDSKSMDEPGSGSSKLAFETLALVSRSLSMLEAGQLCVLGFGEDVRVAHSFDQTFSSSAGANILQKFQFQQTKTDVKKLVSESLRLFREARAQNQNTNSDLWQLELIISDGICEDHEKIRQMIREAHQERIMIVFIIVDALKGTSITTLDQASFGKNERGEMVLQMKRYLADFPFDYYLVVGDVEELPAVLATALRQWFSEIAET